MADIYEIADGIYRISTFIPQADLAFTQFVIKDERPLLFHTGQRALFPETVEAVRKVIDPKALRYISWSHLEADECGAANEFLQIARQAEPVQGQVGVMVGVSDFFIRPVMPMNDGDVLDLGNHKLRFLMTPHVPHAWDAILVYEETTGTLLASGFVHPVWGKGRDNRERHRGPDLGDAETLSQLSAHRAAHGQGFRPP